MLPTLARKAAGQPQVSFLARRRLRHAGLDEKKAWLARNLGSKLGRIQSKALKPCEDHVTSASGFDLLCSYSWRVESKMQLKKRPLRPQIYVPVTRRSWMRHYRDVNTARMPLYPFEPMFQSMSVMNPGFRFDDVDLIINRNSLGHLLRFVNGKAKHHFRLDLAMVQNTLVVTPTWERVFEKMGEEGNHGRDFEDLFARRTLQDNGSYHRAIRYNLGPLNCAVLSELDVALPSSGEAISSHDKQWKFHPKPSRVDEKDLSEAYQPNTVAERIVFKRGSQTSPESPRLRHAPCSKVIRRGNGTFSKDAAELSASTLAPFRKMPQLWFGRVPFLIRGTYIDGSFTEVDVIYHATSFIPYENEIQPRLQKLVSLISTLRESAKNATDQRCIVICDKTVQPIELRIFEYHRTPPLPVPVDIQRHFWTSNETGSQS
ncbi:hypothetical protein J7T55_004237 [Diaporthe amygdali]|uniref:uncharacterized protein n=1 Tax=Phomopsis amygdali TaxID=1214568 RepID=UPI0022FE1A4D|nr:uncharacterized protein J7T55_004237 [Diaporthe amygdali]KAJ0103912.1 hypothetical protein J7T55_004237 [Diaporthe amygdali]